MNVKKILVSLSVTGLAISSLTLTGCGGGSASALVGAPPPTPTITLNPTPVGYQYPTGGVSNGNSDMYISTTSPLYFALPQGAGLNPVITSGPAGIDPSSIISASVQQFGPSGSTPVAIVTSGSESNTVVNTATSSTFSSATSIAGMADEESIWHQYGFANMVSTSTPVAVAANNGVYIGIGATGESSANSFLAYNGSTSSVNAVAVTGASKIACSVNAGSTFASTIASTTTNGSNVVAIGTNYGEVLIYNTTTPGCSNLTNATRAQQVYTLGSPITAVAFTSTSSANYGYFVTEANQIWRIVANTSNSPQSFTQIAGSGSTFANLPAGNITALFSDSNNNVYAGSSNGTIYTLAPTVGGNTNTVWTSVSSGNSPVLTISATSNGKIIATTVNGIFNVSFNGS